MTGRIRREGCFLQIDTLDDRRSRFDKTNKSYYPSGQLHEEMYYSNGHLEGEYKQYDETGELRLEAFYFPETFPACIKPIKKTVVAEL